MANKFYLDLSDQGVWLIKRDLSERFTAGRNKEKAQALIERLNQSHRPNIEQPEPNKILICWNNHDKGEKCDFEEVVFV